MERKPQAVIGTWECVKFGHSGTRCHFSPSCGPGSFPVILLIAALQMLRTHGASWARSTASASKRGKKLVFTQTSGSAEGNRANEQSGMAGFQEVSLT